MDACKVDGCKNEVVPYKGYCCEHFLEKYGNTLDVLTVVLLAKILEVLNSKK